MNNSDRVFGLDLMRAVAILLVVIGHLGWAVGGEQHSLSPVFAFSSFLGVEIFFVLSGFLIGRILVRMFSGDFSIRQIRVFLKRRWYRTLPNYYLILLANIGIAAFLGYEIEQLSKYFLFLQNFAWPMLPFFTESWSLPIEEFAYIVLPGTLLIGLLTARNGSRKIIFICVVLMLVLAGGIFKYLNHINHPTPTIDQWNLGVKSVVVFRIDSICIGAAFAWISIFCAEIWAKSKHLLAGCGLFGIGFYFIGVGYFRLLIENYPMFWNVFYLPLLSVILALFLPLLSGWNSVANLVARPITYISLISYSLYLVHYGIVLQLMNEYLPVGIVSVPIFVAVYLMATFTISTILYKFYEKPMMDRREPREKIVN